MVAYSKFIVELICATHILTIYIKIFKCIITCTRSLYQYKSSLVLEQDELLREDVLRKDPLDYVDAVEHQVPL